MEEEEEVPVKLLNTKNLIQTFEKGPTNVNHAVEKERVPSRPGNIKTITKAYEKENFTVQETGPVKSTEEPTTKPKKNILLVFAHWEKDSFNGALLDAAAETLEGQGHHVVITDLHRQNFNPVLSRNDIKGEPTKLPLKYTMDAGIAYEKGLLADDIVEEQRKLKDADLVIFQFPITWGSMPAILKGWFERVFIYNFAYGRNAMFNHGHFKNKKAVVSITTGLPAPAYSPSGVIGDIRVHLWTIQNTILRTVGFDVLPPNITYAPAHIDDAERAMRLERWQGRLKNIWNDKPLSFLDLEMFDLAKGMALSDEALQKLSEEKAYDSEIGLTVGQNLGKAIPEKCMLE